MSNGLPSCPDCGGEFLDTPIDSEYQCEDCELRLRESVLSRLDEFERVADRGGPLADVARAALEGVSDG